MERQHNRGGDTWDGTAWARRAFSGVALGDARRSERLVAVAAALAENPHGTLPPALAEWAELKAAYRLLACETVTHQTVTTTHRKNTVAACQEPGQYLMIEDTTQIDLTHRAEEVEGLGPIGDGRGRGMLVHSTLAARVVRWTEAGEPMVTVVGLLAQQCWVRDEEPKGSGERLCDRLRRSRESERWAKAFERVSPRSSGPQWIYVADRESDVYEALCRCREAGVDFVIRAAQPRALADAEGSVMQAVSQAPVLGSFPLELRARPGVAARTATLEMRSVQVTLRGPWRPDRTLPPMTVRVVELRETDALPDAPPVHWVLLTSLPAETFADAWRVVGAYTRRWLVEEYHKALKTGTGLEHTQLTTAARIQALLGILAVVAVRLLTLKLLAVAEPDQPVSAETLGPEALSILQAKFGPPPDGWTYRTVLVCIARLGGFLARRSDGSPGWLTIWRGWQKLMPMIQGYHLAQGGA